MPISNDRSDRIWRSAWRDQDDSIAPPPNTRREPPPATRPSTEYLAFLGNLAIDTTNVDAARDAVVQKKLDGVRDAFSGPYVIEGAMVAARAMFRMTTHHVGKEVERIVDDVAQRARGNGFTSRMGQPTAKELVHTTQALIDAGRLPPGPGDLATRIRKMQWDHGIGVDCAGYSKAALVACSARVPRTYAPGMESFRDLDRERAGSFAKISIASARPGDLITLDAPNGGWGHNVVVYSHVTADVSKSPVLASTDPRVLAFLSTPGPHHILEVDSSWGAGTEGAPEGGYRRDTWLYDESTKKWGSFDPSSQRFVISTSGPAHDDLHGIYRPR